MRGWFLNFGLNKAMILDLWGDKIEKWEGDKRAGRLVGVGPALCHVPIVCRYWIWPLSHWCRHVLTVSYTLALFDSVTVSLARGKSTVEVHVDLCFIWNRAKGSYFSKFSYTFFELDSYIQYNTTQSFEVITWQVTILETYCHIWFFFGSLWYGLRRTART